MEVVSIVGGLSPSLVVLMKKIVSTFDSSVIKLQSPVVATLMKNLFVEHTVP